MKTFFGYIRVSTAKQGEHGVSLQEQRATIESFCERNRLYLSRWFEERETAAKRGRPLFNQMLKLLRLGEAAGVVIHKIDRGARNLKDWADLGELLDQGIEVHFVNESLDLQSRGGRLSADIQAVVAADYIRNLREESRKGFYGRIKQGLFPMPAPIGYSDTGKGKAKEPDPIQAPLVRTAFELYASGRYNIPDLLQEMTRLGLRTRTGGTMVGKSLIGLLHNPFYMGIIRLRKSGETFQGAHQPIVAKSLFDRVQLTFSGKIFRRTQRHELLFRRLLKCQHCGRSLIGEVQKGHAYYRCHTRACPIICVREDAVEAQASQALEPLQFAEDEQAKLAGRLGRLSADSGKQKKAELESLTVRLGQLKQRFGRLTDAYLDQVIDKQVFESRKAVLLAEQTDVEQRLTQIKTGGPNAIDQLSEIIELAGSAYLSYKLATPDEKRDLLARLTSNCTVSGKSVQFMLVSPFNEIANRYKNVNGEPKRVGHRTMLLLDQLVDWLRDNPGWQVRPATSAY